MRQRYGKIARLPRALQIELNRRLTAGHSGTPLLQWLNAQTEVQSLLAGEFGGRPINKQNLSQWRLGSFKEWQLRQEAAAYCQDMALHADELDPILDGRLADSLAALLVARYARLVRNWTGEVTPEFKKSLQLLRGMVRDVAQLRRLSPPKTPDRVGSEGPFLPSPPVALVLESKPIKANQR